MPDYRGHQCIVCQNLFDKDDDIVVCPDCGTPYHRSCYAAKGACINTILHEKNQSWMDLHRPKDKGTTCPNCRHSNAKDAGRCEVCGTSLQADAPAQDEQTPVFHYHRPDGTTQEMNPFDPCCGFQRDEEFDGEKLEDIANFVRTSTFHYIPLFKRFKDTGKHISFSLAALLFPHLYFAYRKMWKYSILVILLMTVCSLPAMMSNLHLQLTTEEFVEMYLEMGMDVTTQFAGLITFVEEHKLLLQRLEIVGTGVQFAARILLAATAHWLYFRHIIRKLRSFRKNDLSPHMRAMLLRSEGGTSVLNAIGAFGLFYGITTIMASVMIMPFMF